MQAVLPVAVATAPPAQAAQAVVRLVEALKVPSAHRVQEPPPTAVRYDPAGHAVQAEPPVVLRYVPIGHETQVVDAVAPTAAE